MVCLEPPVYLSSGLISKVSQVAIGRMLLQPLKDPHQESSYYKIFH